METKGIINIDGRDIPIENEKNVLELIRKADIELPTFCYHSHLSTYGACRLCVSDIDGMGIQATCSVPPRDGMVVKTNTQEVRQIRKVNLELLLANHDVSCPSCSRSNNCKLQDLTRRLGVDKIRFKKTDKIEPIDNKSWSILHDPNKCVLCGDCVRACKEIQSVGAIDFVNRGAKTTVAPAFLKSLADVECVYCGQCVAVCPVGALTPKPETEEVWKAINNPDKYVVAQLAPAVRVALGEGFGMDAGSITTGQIVAALKRLGFDQVYDTSFAADLTVFEEATEFIERKLKGEKLPQFTSCCPSWVKFAEQYYPSLLPNLSSCKSPQQMFGSVAREILPKMLGIKPEQLVIVSIMPCTAKKFEAKREEFIHDGIAEVDHVLTTEGLGRMIHETGINFRKLTPESFDLPMGFKTGAGVIFGNTGGVSEAVLRFAYEKITGEKLLQSDFKMVRGMDGIRTAELELGAVKLKLGVVHSLSNARQLCDQIVSGQSDYDLIEIMACPGGCIAGGGQPVNFEPDFREKRINAIYNVDKQLQLHKAQENPYVKELYQLTLGEVGGSKAHELLHTHYHGRKRINNQLLTIRDTDHPKIEVCVCVGTNCFVKGSQELLRRLMEYVTENKLEDIVGFEGQEEMVDVKATFCFERCDRGPVVRVNQQVIEQATFEKVTQLLNNEINRIGSLLNLENA
ncbi:MAG: NADH-dependent [FeFe] hydrogenase, group A6 [Bacteroidales bacterium]|jgi:NADH-quinone oxidoreductase subunit G|nr:NADH-dependent [FeFe] hydrogenase, group A6 [Bacteroidales bacterium]